MDFEGGIVSGDTYRKIKEEMNKQKKEKKGNDNESWSYWCEGSIENGDDDEFE